MRVTLFAGIVGIVLFGVAVPAGAQLHASKGPAQGASARPSGHATPARPIADLLSRRANPKGPFARLTMPQQDSIVAETRHLLGVRYKWAGLDPATGLDCSGMVKYVFARLGINLPHHAADLARLGSEVKRDTAVMRPGDLLVFGVGGGISHVGIYVGKGMMVHASSSSARVVETPLTKYQRATGLQWKGVRRVFAIDPIVGSGS